MKASLSFRFIAASFLAIAMGLMVGSAITACGTAPPGQEQAVAPSFNNMAVTTVKSVTAARMVARTMLDARKIDVARFDDANKKLDAIVDGIRTARASLPPDAPLTPAQQADVKQKLDKVKADADLVASNLNEGKAP